jgi:hypothetical protein
MRSFNADWASCLVCSAREWVRDRVRRCLAAVIRNRFLPIASPSINQMTLTCRQAPAVLALTVVFLARQTVMPCRAPEIFVSARARPLYSMRPTRMDFIM